MGTFSIPIAELAARVKLDLETVARKSTHDVFRAVALKSPVDTGRFRANWNVSAGAPDQTVTASTDKTRADREVLKALALPVGGVMYMANALPYAVRLEHGWSKQAPAGMVRLSAVEYSDYVQMAISK
jgi:hypothetical protein